MIALEYLRKSDLFEGLCDDELVVISKVAHEENYPAGACIFTQNEPARNIYVVAEGRVAILINIGRGRQTVVDTVCKYSSFGWSALVPPFILTGTARTLEQTHLIVVPGDALRAVCRQNCATCYTIMEKVAAIVSARLKDTRLQLISLIAS